MSDPSIRSAELDIPQRETFDYFVKEANASNGLIADKTQQGTPASIAAVGLALSAYPIGVERNLMNRADAVQRTLTTLRFFDSSVQGIQADGDLRRRPIAEQVIANCSAPRQFLGEDQLQVVNARSRWFGQHCSPHARAGRPLTMPHGMCPGVRLGLNA